MHRTPIAAIAIALTIALTMSLSACGSSSKTGTKGAFPMALTDAGCDPAHIEVPEGSVTFDVTNKGAPAVTQFQVLNSDGTTIGEVDKVTPGQSKALKITLKRGTYTTACPGGITSAKGELIASSKSTVTTNPTQASVGDAVESYRKYVEDEAAALVTATGPFVRALINGDVATAKALYAETRAHYERIEPIAERFGALDPAIDGRENDVPAADFQGFHRIEKQLWVNNNTDGIYEVADGLNKNVLELQARIPGILLDPQLIAGGAVELLNEVATSKITGEEDRYSHTDLWDFEANLEGAHAAIDSLEELIKEKNPSLVAAIESRFAGTESLLRKYKRGDGYVPYTQLTQADTRALATQVDVLADVLAKVGPVVKGD